MGCAFINQKESIKSKDVELNLEITTPYFKEVNDTINIKHAISKGFSELKKPKSKKKANSQINKEQENEKDTINMDNQHKLNYTGPIITMLKRQVDNYKKRENIQVKK